MVSSGSCDSFIISIILHPPGGTQDVPGIHNRCAVGRETEGVAQRLGQAVGHSCFWLGREEGGIQTMALESECCGLQLQLLPPPNCAIWDKSLTSLSPFPHL